MACQQHNSQDPSVPLCPSNGSSIIPENYPARAVSVSDESGGKEWVTKFVDTVLHAVPLKPPQFIMNVSDDTYEAVKQMIEKTPGLTAQRKQVWLSALSRTSTKEDWNWQQDFGQSAIVNGVATFRPDQSYSRAEEVRDSVAGEFAKCGIPTGKPYAPSLSDFDKNQGAENGTMGGNIEGGPAGTCVVGADHFIPEGSTESDPATLYTPTGMRDSATWYQMAKDLCGTGKIIQSPSHFLNVGHTDEIFTTVRTGPGECDMAIAVASPRAAIEALKSASDQPAFDGKIFVAANAKSPRKFRSVYRSFCDSLANSGPGTPAKSVPEKPADGIGMWSPFDILFPAVAHAGPNPVAPKAEPEECQTAAGKLTNGQLATLAADDPQLNLANTEIQRLMDAFKDRLRNAFPNCSATPKIIDLPNMFYGEVTDLGDGKVVVQEAAGIHPNPTNMQQFGDTLIIPDPGNEALRQDMIAKLTGVNPKFKIQFIDTHFAHLNFGNLHCSTNSIRYCRTK